MNIITRTNHEYCTRLVQNTCNESLRNQVGEAGKTTGRDALPRIAQAVKQIREQEARGKVTAGVFENAGSELLFNDQQVCFIESDVSEMDDKSLCEFIAESANTISAIAKKMQGE